MIRVCAGALLSHWRRNPLQLFTFLGGLALATALWAGVQAINAEARASYEAAASTLGEGRFDQLVPKTGNSISQDTFVALRRSGWLVSPVIEGRLGDARLVGIDPLSAPGDIAPRQMSDLAQPLTAAQAASVFVSAETAPLLPEGTAFVVDADIAPGVALADIGVAQDLLGRDDLSRLVVLPRQPLVQAVLVDVAPDLRMQDSQQSSNVAQLTDSFHLNLTAFGLLSFAVGLFIVHSTIGLAFEQRRGMIRTLRSLGVPLRILVTLIAIEMMTLALLAAGIGVLLGYMIAALLLPDVAATLRGLYGAQITGALQFRTEWWLSGLIIAMVGTAVALSGRLWQIANMPLLASVRPRAWVLASGAQQRVQAALALALLVIAGIMVVVASGLVAGFVMLGCLLMGAALLLPVLVGVVLRIAGRFAKGPVSQWFWADTTQQLPGLSLALMSLLLAISANIGVATMVSSFRLTFEAFLDQRLAPELFIQVDDAQSARQIEQYLLKKTDEVLPLLEGQTEVLGLPSQLFGIRVGATYRQNWVFLESAPGTWDLVADAQGAIVNEQLARKVGLWVGDDVPLPLGESLPIVGVVGDYGNPLGQVYVTETVFARYFPDFVPDRFGVRTSDVASLRADLSRDLGLSDSAMINQEEIKAFSIQVFERTFSVTAALNVLTLAVASFAMLMSLLTLADLRVPQLAPVWALGLTRRDLGRLELIRACALAGLVFVCAIPLGLALAWILLAIVNVEAFGWKLPMHLFPGDYARLGVYAIIAATLAAAWPAWRLMRTPPSALLKVFAHER